MNAGSYREFLSADEAAGLAFQGAGRFSGNRDSLLFLKEDENAYFLWSCDDPASDDSAWTKTYIGSLSDDWVCAGIGDFKNDGIDDIVMWQQSTGALFVWADGVAADQYYTGTLDPGSWEAAAVGDYNGDGKDDLMLRETLSGWGGLGFWAGADANQWKDLNCRIETDMESRFAVIA